MRILDLAHKDLRQILRDRKSAVFLLVMPILFTLLFGFSFGGIGGEEATDPRLPVVLLDEDGSAFSGAFAALLTDSPVLRLEPAEDASADELRAAVDDGNLAGLVVVPAGFEVRLRENEAPALTVVADPAGNAGTTLQGEVGRLLWRLQSSAITADISAAEQARLLDRESTAGSFENAFQAALRAWEDPALTASRTANDAAGGSDTGGIESNAFAQSLPGMMAQFAIAGLLPAAEILVQERKSRALRRLLTTAMTRTGILLGHFLAMFAMVLVQLVILVLFGQLLLQLNFFRAPLATLVLVVFTALFAGSLGLLIGTLARSEQQAILFSLIPMFVLAGLGGAWLPLEFTSESFQRIAFYTPVAWIVEGFKDITVRGLGLEAVLPGAGVLTLYALAFFGLAMWRFRSE
jgi:ABC-2 type transport system permease protein